MPASGHALRAILAAMPSPDGEARAAAQARAADVLRPAGALARLDELAVHVAGWLHTPSPRIRRPAGLVFAADHGVAVHGAVSAYPHDVTAAMLAACHQGRATICALAASVGSTLDVVDVGVGDPTGDIRHEPAMTDSRFDTVIERAAAAVESLDTDLLVVGEIGIGNTTAAAAVAACLLGGDADEWVGRGSGVDDEGIQRKLAAVAAVAARVGALADPDPIEVLRHAGGAELAAIAAAVATARLRSIPVILDGYVATAAVLALELAAPGALDHCIVGHRSAEPGHARLLARLGRPAVLDLSMRLGEGSGAMLAVPIVRAACDALAGTATFAEWFGSAAP